MVTYDARTALIVVDVQNDFADPAGRLYVSGGEYVVPRINEEIERARDAAATVFYTQDWHPPHTPHFADDGGIWPVHCVRGTWGAAFHPDLTVEGEIVRKGTEGEDGYSGFSVRDPESGEESPTVLQGLVAAQAIERIVVVGLATDYCVKETVLDACRLGFATTVRFDAIAAVDLEDGDGAQALAAMREAGAHIE
ncbi:MAG: isochorismatase family protein [Chloroflexi bacterium]|nr:isochorismatase family protein [Chloroflexota bacterium]MDA1146503.1 isochorismatase family protein [Chloroflexota bacterium]